MNSFEKIVYLESQIAIHKSAHDADMKSFKDKIDGLEKKIDILLELLNTLQTLGKLASFFQKTVVFMSKVAIASGALYALYKFGLTELAEKVKLASMGGR